MNMSARALRRTSVAATLVFLAAAALAADAQADPKSKKHGNRGRERHRTTQVIRNACPPPVRVAPRRGYVAPRRVYVAPRPVYCAPRPVYVPIRIVTPAPRYCDAPVVRVERRPFFWNAELDLYLPRVFAHVSIGDRAPRGGWYHDPYCDQDFRTLRDYRRHLRGCSHQAVLDVRYSHERGEVCDRYASDSWREGDDSYAEDWTGDRAPDRGIWDRRGD